MTHGAALNTYVTEHYRTPGQPESAYYCTAISREPLTPADLGQACQAKTPDPAVRFWATPPVHGILRPTCVHPEDFTFKLPSNVSFAEAAMVEPLAVGVHAATKARVKPGDYAAVMGAGPIGLVTALSALAGALLGPGSGASGPGSRS